MTKGFSRFERATKVKLKEGSTGGRRAFWRAFICFLPGGKDRKMNVGERRKWWIVTLRMILKPTRPAVRRARGEERDRDVLTYVYGWEDCL